jgi:TRAP-type C4-dicarboxylate transport system substrate-binding protein
MGAAVFGSSNAAELPSTSIKAIGLSSGAVASTEDEAPFWTKTIPTASNGRISVNFLPVDQTGIDSKAMLRLLKLGASDFISIEISKLAGDDPRFEGCDIAGLTQSLEQVRAACEAYRGVIDNALQANWGAKLLAIGYQPPQVFWCRTPIQSFSDIAGKKVRVFNPTMTDVVKAFGATPVEVAFAEVVPALQRGVVDCGVTGTLTGNTARWPEVSTHLMEVPMGWAVYLQIVSLNTWNKFTPETRDFFTAKFRDFEAKMLGTTDAAIKQAANCNYGSGECTKGRPAKMTKVSLKEDELRRYREVVERDVLGKWAQRCGAKCASEWNATIGSAIGMSMPDVK